MDDGNTKVPILVFAHSKIQANTAQYPCGLYNPIFYNRTF